jgi:hypothetical protein
MRILKTWNGFPALKTWHNESLHFPIRLLHCAQLNGGAYMKKWLAGLLVGAALLSAPAITEAQQQRGGIGGFLVGCCFGVRTAGEFNAGKDLHFREWARLIPYVGVVFAIWDGIDGAQNVTTSQLQQSYGTQYY